MLIPSGIDAARADAGHPAPTPASAPGEVEEILVQVSGAPPVRATSDPFSDRIRCDHPAPESTAGLPEALLDRAREDGRGRVVALVPEAAAAPFVQVGYEIEGVMPGFYAGEQACAVVGAALDPEREGLANPLEVARVDALVRHAAPGREHPAVATRLATPRDALALAQLIGETFHDYPTPSHDPGYLGAQMVRGVPFRVVEQGGEIVACASADLVSEARTAELTDCATRPTHRGRGYMQCILRDLMGDLRELGYPTAFTLARARIAGVNLAFERLGFEFCGRMVQSCRIGDGIEDMNIWSRRLAAG